MKLDLSNEYAFINRHMPSYLQDYCSNNIAYNLPDGFTHALFGDQQPVEFSLYTQEFNINDLFPKIKDVKFASIGRREEDILGWDDSIPQMDLSNLMEEFGRDAFGMYLPFHYFRDCWGIYLFKDNIQSRVTVLHEIFKDKIDRDTLLRMYEYAVYRHELFHYQVERFATKIEIIKQQRIYGPSRRINQVFKKSADWLEEALAESSVVNSKLVPNRTHLSPKLVKEIYERDLQDMPDGYKHYKCKKYKGEKNAHRHFATQICRFRLIPKKNEYLTEMVSIKNEFIALDKKVHAYMVTGFANAMPIKM